MSVMLQAVGFSWWVDPRGLGHQIAFGSALHAGVEGMHAQFVACVLDDSSAVILVCWGLQTAWLFRHAGHKRVVHTRLW